MFLLHYLNAFYIVLQSLQLCTDRFALFLQRNNFILKSFLFRVCYLFSLHQRVNSILSFNIFKPFLGHLNFSSQVSHNLSKFFSFHHLLLQKTHIFLHSLMSPIAPSELLESLRLIEHLL